MCCWRGGTFDLNVEIKENLSVEHWSEKEKLQNVRVRYDIRRGVREKCSRYKYAEESSRCKPEEKTMIGPQ